MRYEEEPSRMGASSGTGVLETGGRFIHICMGAEMNRRVNPERLSVAGRAIAPMLLAMDILRP
jgi:hypothetical protein